MYFRLQPQTLVYVEKFHSKLVCKQSCFASSVLEGDRAAWVVGAATSPSRSAPCLPMHARTSAQNRQCMLMRQRGGLLSGDDALYELLRTMKPLHKGRKRLAGRRERERGEREGGNPLFFQGLNSLRVYSVSGARRHISTSISF